MVGMREQEAYDRVARHTQERFAGVGDEEVAHRIGNARENAAKDGSTANAGDYGRS
jgi:hypothetical protein